MCVCAYVFIGSTRGQRAVSMATVCSQRLWILERLIHNTNSSSKHVSFEMNSAKGTQEEECDGLKSESAKSTT